MDLSEFLLARVAEDEAVARAMVAPDQMHPWGDTRKPRGKPEDVPDWIRGYLGGTWGEHFARHDPARVLAECEAKRELVRDHGVMVTKWGTQMCVRCNTRPGETPWPCRTLRLLALPHVDHTDYDPAWRP